MAQITVNMNLKTRPAIYRPNKWRADYLGFEEGAEIRVDVFGIYQVAIDEEVDAYFVITLPSGKCTYAGVTEIQFTDMGVPDDADDESDSTDLN